MEWGLSVWVFSASVIQDTNIYKKVRDPLKHIDKLCLEDLQAIRPYFVRLALMNVDMIDKEIEASLQALKKG
jgi:hypothetical protein